MKDSNLEKPAKEMGTIDRIQSLVDKGILGPEQCPEDQYWHWPILRPAELPKEFEEFKTLGEVRWYGEK